MRLHLYRIIIRSMAILIIMVLSAIPNVYAGNPLSLIVKPGETKKTKVVVSSNPRANYEIAYIEFTATNSLPGGNKSTDVQPNFWGPKQCTGIYTAYNALNRVIYKWSSTQSYHAYPTLHQAWLDGYSIAAEVYRGCINKLLRLLDFTAFYGNSSSIARIYIISSQNTSIPNDVERGIMCPSIAAHERMFVDTDGRYPR